MFSTRTDTTTHMRARLARSAKFITRPSSFIIAVSLTTPALAEPTVPSTAPIFRDAYQVTTYKYNDTPRESLVTIEGMAMEPQTHRIPSEATYPKTIDPISHQEVSTERHRLELTYYEDRAVDITRTAELYASDQPASERQSLVETCHISPDGTVATTHPSSADTITFTGGPPPKTATPVPARYLERVLEEFGFKETLDQLSGDITLESTHHTGIILQIEAKSLTQTPTLHFETLTLTTTYDGKVQERTVWVREGE